MRHPWPAKAEIINLKIHLRPVILLLATVLLGAAVLIGCRSPQTRSPAGAGLSTRNNGYSLLHQLLDEQKDVSLLRFIKPEHALSLIHI